jgi:hypothetical protein
MSAPLALLLLAVGLYFGAALVVGALVGRALRVLRGDRD